MMMIQAAEWYADVEVAEISGESTVNEIIL